jgi:hypothetical protein
MITSTGKSKLTVNNMPNLTSWLVETGLESKTSESTAQILSTTPCRMTEKFKSWSTCLPSI